MTARASESGFTLVEALISIVVLAVGLTAVSNLFLVATSSNQVANKQSATAVQASEVMERLKVIPWLTLNPGNGATVGNLDADAGARCDETVVNPATGLPAPTGMNCVAPGVFTCYRTVAGVATIRTRWRIQSTAADMLYITVRSEAIGPFGGQLSRAEFAAFRTCALGNCPYVGS